MKPSPLNRLIVLSAFAGLAATNSLSAAVLSWDGTDTNANANGGAGTWDTTTANWDTAATSGAAATWPTSGTDNDANFGGTAGTVTIATGGVTANDITFSTTGYTITGAGLTLNGTLPVLNVTGTQTINSAITSAVTGGFSKTGTGTLILGGANTFPASTTLAFNPVGSAGAIRLTNGSALSGITIINGVPASSTTSEARIELTNDITVTGTELRIGGRASFQSTGAGLVNISGNNTWAGAVRIFSTGGGHGIRSDAGALTISGAVNSNIGARQWDIGGAGNVTITGAITTAVTINKFGTGTLLLSGSANTYTGDTRPSAGSLVIGHTNALSGSNLNMVAADTGTVSFDGTTALSLGGLKGDRDLSIANSSAVSQSLTIGGASTNTYSATLSGLSTAIAKVGAGTQIFSGASNSWSVASLQTRAGTFQLNAGTLAVTGSAATGYSAGQTGFTVVGGSTFRVNGGTVNVSGGAYVFTAGHTTGGTGSFILDSGTFNAGNLEALNAYGATGTTTINGGTMTVGVFRVAQATGTLNLNGGTLRANNLSHGGGASTVNFNGGTLEAKQTNGAFLPTTITNARIRAGGAIINTSTFNVTAAKALTEDATSTGGGLSKQGSGTLTLTGANNYSGATTVNAGTLSVNGAGLGSRGAITSGNTATFSPVTVTPSGAGVTSATLELNGATVNAVATLNGTGTDGNAASLINSNTGTSAVLDTGVLGMTFTSTGTTWNLASQTTSPLSITGGGATTNAIANVNLATTTGTFTASDGTGWVTGNTLTVSGGGSTQSAVYNVTASGGAITGLTQTQAGIGFTTFTGLTYTGAKGTAVPAFTGVGGTFTGVDGTFTLSSIALATNGRGYTGSATITSTDGGGTFTGSTPATVPSLTLVGTQNQIGGAGGLTINTVIGGSGGGFSKIGAGTVTLSGTNTYTGGTTVSAGSLLVTNTTGSATGTGAVTVSGGLLGGTGSVAGNVTIATGARLDPGTTTGTLTVGGTVSGAGTVALQLTDAGSDKLVAGGITPSALTLELSVTGTLTADAYVLVDSTSAPASSFAAVSGVPSGYSVSYSYNDGVDSNNIALVKDGGSTPFQNWAGTTHGLSGPDAEPGADPDFDGLSNLVEFVIGGNPKASGDSIPTATVNGANMVFTFPRTDLSSTEPGLTSAAEYSTTLDAWTPAVDGTDGVSIVVTNDGIATGVDKVEVSVPLSLSASGKLFARLKATKP
jgi:fibronectin-binding autotransporter adhesin